MIFSYRDKCRANHVLRQINFYITCPQFVHVESFLLFNTRRSLYLLNASLMASRRCFIKI